jgi:hypothetical protein
MPPPPEDQPSDSTGRRLGDHVPGEAAGAKGRRQAGLRILAAGGSGPLRVDDPAPAVRAMPKGDPASSASHHRGTHLPSEASGVCSLSAVVTGVPAHAVALRPSMPPAPAGTSRPCGRWRGAVTCHAERSGGRVRRPDRRVPRRHPAEWPEPQRLDERPCLWCAGRTDDGFGGAHQREAPRSRMPMARPPWPAGVSGGKGAAWCWNRPGRSARRRRQHPVNGRLRSRPCTLGLLERSVCHRADIRRRR